MSNDVIIGEGNKGNSAVKIWSCDTNHTISENAKAYWISDCILNIGMIIFKDTKEGKELANLLQNGKQGEITLWLDELALKHFMIWAKLLKQKKLKLHLVFKD